MSYHQPRIWSAALAELRDAGHPAAPVYVVAGRYHLAGIMAEACRTARRIRAGGKSWSWRMSVALKVVWKWAREAMAAPKAVAVIKTPAAPLAPPAPRQTFTPRFRTFVRGSRVHSHGW